jgi:hypothetical protein
MAIFLILLVLEFVDLVTHFAIIQPFKIPYYLFYNRLETRVECSRGYAYLGGLCGQQSLGPSDIRPLAQHISWYTIADGFFWLRNGVCLK